MATKLIQPLTKNILYSVHLDAWMIDPLLYIWAPYGEGNYGMGSIMEGRSSNDHSQGRCCTTTQLYTHQNS